MSPSVFNPLGLGVDVQVLWKGAVADEAYVSGRRWENAILAGCPLHPGGGCGLQRLGTYTRVWPRGCRIARFWCPRKRASISLLPESLAAHVKGSLDALEEAVDAVEAHGISRAVDEVFPADAEVAVGIASATRSLRRRVRWVRAVLLAIVTLFPDRFVGVQPTLPAMRATLGVERVLVALRGLPALVLDSFVPPFGFRARASA